MRLVSFSLFAGSAVAELYCPSQNDLTIAYCDEGNKQHPIMWCPQLNDGGWTIQGGGGAATKSSFNLNGGYVEYDIDFSNVNPGVNANIYTIAPQFRSGPSFNKNSDYCDGAAHGSDWCPEMDWIETNGRCGGASTIHTIDGDGNDGCTGWGCRSSYHYNSGSHLAMRVDYDWNGQSTIRMNGQVVGNFDPWPDNRAWGVVKDFHEQRGAVIYSSEWSGWTPVDDCGSGGDLYTSSFTVSNLRISGSVVQGSEPTKCAGLVPLQNRSQTWSRAGASSPEPYPEPEPSRAPLSRIEQVLV